MCRRMPQEKVPQKLRRMVPSDVLRSGMYPILQVRGLDDSEIFVKAEKPPLKLRGECDVQRDFEVPFAIGTGSYFLAMVPLALHHEKGGFAAKLDFHIDRFSAAGDADATLEARLRY